MTVQWHLVLLQHHLDLVLKYLHHPKRKHCSHYAFPVFLPPILGKQKIETTPKWVNG